jgi:hypothetical protein
LRTLEPSASERSSALLRIQAFWSWIESGWNRFWYPPTESFDLGFARCLFFGWVFYSTLQKDFVVWGDLPFELFYPMPFMRLVNYPVASAAALEILQALWRTCLVFGCIGFLTRVSALVASILTGYLWTLTYGFSQEAHGSIPLIFGMFVLAAARSADSFSIDSLLFRDRHKSNRPSPDYGWPMRLISSLYILMFFGAAVTKLRNSGIDWGLNALTNIFYQRRTYASPRGLVMIDFFLNHLPMKAVSMSALLVELAAPLALFPGLIRVFVLPALMLMQLVILEVMGLDFRPTFALIPFFVPWSDLRRFLSKSARSLTGAVLK